MSAFVFTAIMFSAALHAGWNLLAKSGADKEGAIVAIVVGHVPYAVVCLLIVAPPAPESWPFIIAGAAIHLGYQVFLEKAYQLGDYSIVYPVARGTAPIIIAIVSILLLGKVMPMREWASIIFICAGVTCLAIPAIRQSDRSNLKSMAVAVLTGGFISGYSVIDGIGAVKAETALGFYSWLSLLNALFMVLLCGLQKRKSPSVKSYISSSTFWFGGGASFSAFAITIWAFTQAPIALVSALRETSIVFALVFGHYLLKEKKSRASYASITFIVMGLALSRLS